MGEKEDQVKALREARWKRRNANLKIPVREVSGNCPQCAMYVDEIKRLKRELSKARRLK